jgi:hypothetical protein
MLSPFSKIRKYKSRTKTKLGTAQISCHILITILAHFATGDKSYRPADIDDFPSFLINFVAFIFFAVKI